MQILIVDDDSLAAELIASVLEDLGHASTWADNALSALDVLQGGARIDLIISDMNMPLMSGLELFQELQEQGAQIAFVLLSGDDPALLAQRAPGIMACLAKDFDLPERLAQLLAELTGGMQS